MSRAAIGQDLGVGSESAKAPLRDGKFYEAPTPIPNVGDWQPTRTRPSAEALPKTSPGRRGLSAPKAHGCWKDANVLFERHEG
ncbi:hypothetical protein IW249_004266 [Micromonospora vinacea]|uniref:Uncharacterized protein n=1 Tax=Micromonospora vinacea TaxID=709878 RepID=A0ABS0K5G4_9ACTN|nr:hypothetical protein [Micromonospora vinacea]MBG6103852.1 hypothetical protein [Micromonospora vinacea]